MKINVKIFRYNPAEAQPGRLADFQVRLEPGISVLALLHQVHDEQDGTLAYRYSCRGAICGTCAVRVNGIARLACKTQVAQVVGERDVLTIEPLANLGVIKDLVVDRRIFWQKIEQTTPWLVREKDLPDERFVYETAIKKAELEQLQRAADCIKCSCCFADCPKVAEDPEFIGPAAAVQIFKQVFDPRDRETSARLQQSAGEHGIFGCDQHANCIKVCPKDSRPLRAITMIRQKTIS